MNISHLPKIIINSQAYHNLQNAYLWIFSNQIKEHLDIENGSFVEILSPSKGSLGVGFYNRNSLISVRALMYDSLPDTTFFINRINKAFEYRKKIFPNKKIIRLVFGESDFLPGLIIDKYENYFALQILSAGMQKCINQIVESLIHIFPETNGIIEKNQSYFRQYEGLELYESIIYGKIPDFIPTEEFGIKINISLKEGQKTGYYLDQSLNRLSIRNISQNLKVLDCFTNQGGFALSAAYAGADEVLAIDSSKLALSIAEMNIATNKYTNIKLINADVFDFLKESNEEWDMIILDPPSFTKNKKSIKSAKQGYFILNRSAMRRIRSGGYLVSSSCSQHIDEFTFIELISKAAKDTQKKLRMVHRGMQSPDHPILLSMPETQYLKFFIFQVL